MKYNIIKSGSKGNSVIINDFILIDCGVSFELLKDYYKKLKVVFITHRHADHFNKSCVKKLISLRPTLKFVVGDYLAQDLINCGLQKKHCIILPRGNWYDLGAFKCKLDDIPHDVPNVAINLDIDNQKLIYATDTSNIDNVTAKDYDFYLIEGNYKEEELEKRKEEKILNGEFVIEDRIANSHLSYEKCIEYFMKMSKDSSILEVMHQHKDKKEEL